MTTPPVRTPEQRTADLELARRSRSARAQIKRQLQAGSLALSDVIGVGHRGVGDPIIGRLKIGQVLRAVPDWGPVRTARLLQAVGIDGDRHLDTISGAVLDEILNAAG